MKLQDFFCYLCVIEDTNHEQSNDIADITDSRRKKRGNAG